MKNVLPLAVYFGVLSYIGSYLLRYEYLPQHYPWLYYRIGPILAALCGVAAAFVIGVRFRNAGTIRNLVASAIVVFATIFVTLFVTGWAVRLADIAQIEWTFIDLVVVPSAWVLVFRIVFCDTASINPTGRDGHMVWRAGWRHGADAPPVSVMGPSILCYSDGTGCLPGRVEGAADIRTAK